MINQRERKAKNNNNVNLMDTEENADIEELITTKWDINEKLKSNYNYFKFSKDFTNGINFTKKTLEKDGFSVPILFLNSDGLGLNLPVDDFGVNDVAICVGNDRVLDVVDVITQDAIGMTMKDWCNYFNNPIKDRLLNVISLEYSQTKMDEIVKAPDIILEIDWLESCWPQSCRDISVDNQSYLKSLTYPKVRKYCLMGTSGCFTDFHIDLGGTSVWYHIFKGEKIFWMVPPTEENLNIFEKWCISIDQSSHFFGDLVEKCEKVHLKKGNTFMIPSGWIHGVYTPVDTLVFGGNFLHSFSISKQLRIYTLEERIKVNTKYRYPFFVEMHWYALATFVSRVNGKSYIKGRENQKYEVDIKSQGVSSLNEYERIGLFIIYLWLSTLSASQNQLIQDKITNLSELLSDAELIIKSMPLVFSSSKVYQEFETYTTKLIKFQKEWKKSIRKKKAKLLVSKTDDGPPLVAVTVDSGDSCPSLSTVDTALSKAAKRPRLCRPTEPEMPLDMFHRITASHGRSRQIKRPDRLIEVTTKK